MKALLILCFFFIGIHSLPISNPQLDTPWDLFKRTYEKQYQSNDEEDTRRSIWETHLIMIRKHNLEADVGLHTYTLGINQFSDMTNEEFNAQMKGLDMSLKDQFADQHSETFVAPADFQLPDSVDWRTQGYVTAVKDQKQCGSCWAFSATGALEGQHFAKTQKLVPLSEQNLVDCSQKFGNFGCKGGFPQNAFLYIRNNSGIDTESSYPYQAGGKHCRFNASNVGATDDGYVQIAQGDENALQTAIATVGPISVAIDASRPSFQHYRSGVYNDTLCSPYQLDHAVLAVGYGTVNGKDYYIVKNSWGLGWGNHGYIWMSRNQGNQCGIATLSCYPRV